MRSGRLRIGILISGLLSGFLSSPGLAQSEAPADYNALRTPSSPAFVLLGVEPSSVERPNTPSDFAASILSATSNLTSLPRDFALETSPYWLFPHKFKSWREDTTRSLIESIERTFTVSAATAELGTADQPIRGVAVSGRMSLFSGRLPASSIKQIRNLETALAASAAQDLSRLDPQFQRVDSIMFAKLALATTDAERNAIKDAATAERAAILESNVKSGVIGADTKALSARADQVATARTGLQVDLAGGATWKAPSAVIDSADFDRWGLWINASYVTSDVSFIALGRYLNIDGTNHDVFDIGGKFQYTRDAYAVSAEYIGRHVKGNSSANTWRLAGVFDYRVSSKLWLTGTFGRSFDDNAKGSLLAQLGVSLNLSKQRYDYEETP